MSKIVDKRLLALADAVNSASPAEEFGALKHNLAPVEADLPRKTSPRRIVSPPGYSEPRWQRASRKLRIVNMFTRMGKQRMKGSDVVDGRPEPESRESHEDEDRRGSLSSFDSAKAQVAAALSSHRHSSQSYLEYMPGVDQKQKQAYPSRPKPAKEPQSVKTADPSSVNTADDPSTWIPNITDVPVTENAPIGSQPEMNDIQTAPQSISIQTELCKPVEPVVVVKLKKPKKIKTKSRGSQVALENDHLTLLEYLRDKQLPFEAKQKLENQKKQSKSESSLINIEKREALRSRSLSQGKTMPQESSSQVPKKSVAIKINNDWADTSHLEHRASRSAKSQRKDHADSEQVKKGSSRKEGAKKAAHYSDKDHRHRHKTPETQKDHSAKGRQATSKNKHHGSHDDKHHTGGDKSHKQKHHNDAKSTEKHHDKSDGGRHHTDKKLTDIHNTGKHSDKHQVAKQHDDKHHADKNHREKYHRDKHDGNDDHVDKHSSGKQHGRRQRGDRHHPDGSADRGRRLKEQDKKGSTQTKDSEVVQTKEDEPDFQPPQDMDIERLAEPVKKGAVLIEESGEIFPQLNVPRGTGDAEGNFEEGIPPGDVSLIELEAQISPVNPEKEDGDILGLDPEVIKKVEDQIFSKIKFYQDVKAHVREKTWIMKKKISLLQEANEYTTRFEGQMKGKGSGSKVTDIKRTVAKLSREFSNFTAMMVPWEGRIRDIESYFGSVVASYFTFLRWLFWINFVMAAICGVVITMPEVMFGPDWGTVDYKSLKPNETKEAGYLKTLWNFDGYAMVSPLFYGYYSSTKRFDSGYRMPFAYMLGNLMMFGYSFLTILRQIAENSKGEKASDKDDNFTFSWKTFASWDYMIGNEETAKNKYKALVIAIREAITENKESAKKITKTRKFLRYFANFLTLCVLGASTYAIMLTVQRSKEFEARAKEFGPDSVSWIESNEISIIMSLVTALFPILFDLIANLEDYHPRIALQWSLRRIMVLYLLNLYTLYIALYGKIQDIQKQAEEANATFYASINISAIVPCTTTPVPQLTTSSDHQSSTASQTVTTSSFFMENQTTPLPSVPCGIPNFIPDVICWETMVGQELIKLTMFDFVTTIALIYLTEFFKACFIKLLNTCWCWDLEKFFPCYAEFSLAENLLHLVYNQGMIWMGTLFCPGLPAFNLLKLLCLFYVRAWSVMVCNVPHERIFKAGSENFYLMLLMFMLYVVMVPIAFAMVSIRPSRNCGPYRETEYMYLIITEWIKDVFPETVFSILKYLTSPGALIPIFILLWLWIYSLSSSKEALEGSVVDLKKQLQYERTEGKKKVFNMKKGDSKPVAATAALVPADSMSKLEQSNTTVSNPMAIKFVEKLKGKVTESHENDSKIKDGEQ